MMMRFLAVGLLGLLAANAAAQKPKGEPVPSPTRPVLTSEQRAQAITLLRRHAKASKSVKVLVADYVQTRTTALSTKPLRSRGKFLFVRQPACVMFRANKPRTSIVRLTKDLYEVFRPRRKRLERFTLRGPDLSQGLFSAVGGDAGRLLKEFDVVGFSTSKRSKTTDRPASMFTIMLVPKEVAMRQRLRELVMTLAVLSKAKPAVVLRAVAYRDHGGDLVEIALQNARANPDDAPSATFDVPKDTLVIEHGAGR